MCNQVLSPHALLWTCTFTNEKKMCERYERDEGKKMINAIKKSQHNCVGTGVYYRYSREAFFSGYP